MPPRRSSSGDPKSRESQKGPKIPPTTWPESLPTKNDDCFVSISCGNTHLHWALHSGIEQRFLPSFFWRTQHFDPSRGSVSPSVALSTHIPANVRTLVFGGEAADPTKENARRHSLKRRIPCLTVYVVASNQEQAEHISFMWSEIPCRLYILQGDDFFTKKQGRYSGMGVDRLASLFGAVEEFGPRTLVIDGGTAMTFTGADNNGNVMGGTIGPGVLLSLDALANNTEALPIFEYKDIEQFVEKTNESGKPLSAFENTRDTRHAMLTQAMLSAASTMHTVITQFAAQIPSEDEERSKPIDVVLCGGDASLLHKLLPPHKIVKVPSDFPEVTVRTMPRLIHYGIAHMLNSNLLDADGGSNYETEVQLVGQRVAKEFDDLGDTSDFIFRGTVMSLGRDDKKDESLYRILYDDNDTEDLSEVELYAALLLYAEHGERGTKTVGPGVNQRTTKVTSAKASAKLLADTSKAVKASLHKKAPRLPVPLPPPPPPKPSMKPDGASAALAVEPVEPTTDESVAKTSEPKSKPVVKRPSSHKEKEVPKKKKAKKKHGGGFVGERIAKKFLPHIGAKKKVIFFGEIVRHWTISDEDGKTVNLWHVVYDDDDAEDMGEIDLRKGRVLYEKHRANDKNAKDNVME